MGSEMCIRDRFIYIYVYRACYCLFDVGTLTRLKLNCYIALYCCHLIEIEKWLPVLEIRYRQISLYPITTVHCVYCRTHCFQNDNLFDLKVLLKPLYIGRSLNNLSETQIHQLIIFQHEIYTVDHIQTQTPDPNIRR